MEKALEILKHIEELYVAEPDFAKIERMAKNNPERVSAWEEAFAEYDLTDILLAIDDFWNYKSSKSKPSVAQLKAILTSKKVETEENSPHSMRSRILKCADELGEKYGKSVRDKYLANFPDYDFTGHSWQETQISPRRGGFADYAVSLMQQDIRLGNCRHLLPVYQKAVRYVIEELLLTQIPSAQWQGMTFGERCEASAKLGLFNRIREILVSICRQNYGKDYQFESKSQMNKEFDMTDKIKRIASHYRTDEAEMARAAGL